MNDDKFLEEMKVIKKRLDQAANCIIMSDYENGGKYLINGYMEYHNLLKSYVADIKKYREIKK